MKKTTLLSMIFVTVMIFGSCNTLHKNGKSKDEPVKEQSLDEEEDASNEDANNDW